MKKTNLKQYISYVKQQKNISIEDELLEKDYMISLFLSTWKKQKENLSSLEHLIFKGGTLLSRNFLHYPRISEDLDFTFDDSNRLRLVKSDTRREKEIKKLVIDIISDIKKISKSSGFDFNVDRTDQKYIQVRNSRAVYLFFLYYPSLLTGELNSIKIEINFLEHRFFDYIENRIHTIIEPDLYLKSIGYNIENAVVKTYDLNEIILEKYRAILTRGPLKKRDILDLYFIHRNSKDVFTVDTQLIKQKIEDSYLISPVAQTNFTKNIELIKQDTFGESDDRVEPLLLKKIEKEDFTIFQKELLQKLKTII